MRLLRAAAIFLALSLMFGELWRSWGVGRPVMYVLDDQLIGGFLFAAAWAVRNETIRNRIAFGAAWGLAAGMLYASFFGKVYEPELMQEGNWDAEILTILIGVAFAISLISLALSIILQPLIQEEARDDAKT